MSLIDENGSPLAYGWNEIAAQELFEKNPKLRLISDEEFERRFPDIVNPPAGEKSGSKGIVLQQESK